MGKGDGRRPSQVPDEHVASEWERVFGVKKLNIMSEEERLELAKEKAEADSEVGGTP